MEKILKRLLRGWLRRRVVKYYPKGENPNTEKILSRKFLWIYGEHLWAWPSCLYCLRHRFDNAKATYKWLQLTPDEDVKLIEETTRRQKEEYERWLSTAESYVRQKGKQGSNDDSTHQQGGLQ